MRFTRRTLFWKYALYFAGIVSALLIFSGALGGYFAYRESVSALEQIQRRFTLATVVVRPAQIVVKRAQPLPRLRVLRPLGQLHGPLIPRDLLLRRLDDGHHVGGVDRQIILARLLSELPCLQKERPGFVGFLRRVENTTPF